MDVKFYIKLSKFAVINEMPKIWLNVSFRRQKKFKNMYILNREKPSTGQNLF